MTKRQKHHIRMDLTLRITDEAALRDFAVQRMRTAYEGDPDMLLDELSELRNGHIASLSIALVPEFLTSMIPGIHVTESECSITSEPAGKALHHLDTEPAIQSRQPTAGAITPSSPLDDMAKLGAMVHIHALEEYTKEFEDSNPQAEGFSTNTLLTGALMWSFETLVDSLFEDISFQRNRGTEIKEMWCLS